MLAIWTGGFIIDMHLFCFLVEDAMYFRLMLSMKKYEYSNVCKNDFCRVIKFIIISRQN